MVPYILLEIVICQNPLYGALTYLCRADAFANLFRLAHLLFIRGVGMSVDPNRTAPDLSLHCLLMSL